MTSERYKSLVPFEKRLEDGIRIMKEYPDRIPVICEKSLNFKTHIPLEEKRKYLVPKELTIGQLIFAIRKRLNLSSSQAIFVIVNQSVLLSSNTVINSIYEEYKDADNYLYLTYCCENTFGKVYKK
jgi:GABA(A) receptor-associated protein